MHQHKDSKDTQIPRTNNDKHVEIHIITRGSIIFVIKGTKLLKENHLVSNTNHSYRISVLLFSVLTPHLDVKETVSVVNVLDVYEGSGIM